MPAKYGGTGNFIRRVKNVAFAITLLVRFVIIVGTIFAIMRQRKTNSGLDTITNIKR